MTYDADALRDLVPFARNLNEPARALMAQRVRMIEADAASTLLSPGDAVSGLYIVESGAVRVHYLDAQGNEGTLYRLEPGECCILALNCLFSEMHYPAWADAEEEGARLLVLDGPTARELVNLDASFLKALFEQASDRVFRLLGTLEQAIRLPLEARLARLLLDIAGQGNEVRLSHDRLASHLGTSREVISRLVRALVKIGAIETFYGRIEIADRALLQSRCQN